MTLSGKKAVVTGASGGIGSATALHLAQAGADVVLCAHRSREKADQVASEINRLGRESAVLEADISDPGEVTDLVQAAWSWGGGIDVWVNNAGADVLTGDAASWTFEQKLHQLLQVDVLGTVNCARETGRRMQEVGSGVIINVGWDQAWHGMEGDSGEMFAATKGAIMSFTKSLAKTLSPQVRVNCVAPGWIKTAWGEDSTDYWTQRAIDESLRARWGTPQDVANAVCFLASDAADFINGQVLPVNGGFRAWTQRDSS